MRRLADLAAFSASCVVLATAAMACGGGSEKPPLTPDTVEPDTSADAGTSSPSPSGTPTPASSAVPAPPSK